MAKKILSTDFKDDVLASTMSEKRRYREIQNIDGTVSFEDVTDYTQIGSTFGAGQINAMNEAANNSFDASKIIDDYDTLLANTQSGYAAGALAVKELNSNLAKDFTFTLKAAHGDINAGYKIARFIFDNSTPIYKTLTISPCGATDNITAYLGETQLYFATPVELASGEITISLISSVLDSERAISVTLSK